MDPIERTPLEQAWLHVIAGEVQVMAQAIRLGELLSLRRDTSEAIAAFEALEDELHALRETLKLEQAASALRRA